MEIIFLTGPKHSGKTSVGRALAFLCSCDFIDLDDMITQNTGKTPRELYAEGPEIFRKVEAEALAAIVKSDKVKESRHVVAIGGGTIDNPDALTMFHDNCLMVYLDVSAENAWGRIVNSSNGALPPFLQTDNPEKTHRALHEKRAAAYWEMAKMIVDTEGKTPEEIAGEILSKITFSPDGLF